MTSALCKKRRGKMDSEGQGSKGFEGLEKVNKENTNVFEGKRWEFHQYSHSYVS